MGMDKTTWLFQKFYEKCPATAKHIIKYVLYDDSTLECEDKYGVVYRFSYDDFHDTWNLVWTNEKLKLD